MPNEFFKIIWWIKAVQNRTDLRKKNPLSPNTSLQHVTNKSVLRNQLVFVYHLRYHLGFNTNFLNLWNNEKTVLFFRFLLWTLVIFITIGGIKGRPNIRRLENSADRLLSAANVKSYYQQVSSTPIVCLL